jgi:hypothetical protein
MSYRVCSLKNSSKVADLHNSTVGVALPVDLDPEKCLVQL